MIVNTLCFTPLNPPLQRGEIDTSPVLPLGKGELEGVAPRLSYLFHIMGDGTLQLMRFPIQRL